MHSLLTCSLKAHSHWLPLVQDCSDLLQITRSTQQDWRSLNSGSPPSQNVPTETFITSTHSTAGDDLHLSLCQSLLLAQATETPVLGTPHLFPLFPSGKQDCWLHAVSTWAATSAQMHFCISLAFPSQVDSWDMAPLFPKGLVQPKTHVIVCCFPL